MFACPRPAAGEDAISMRRHVKCPACSSQPKPTKIAALIPIEAKVIQSAAPADPLPPHPPPPPRARGGCVRGNCCTRLHQAMYAHSLECLCYAIITSCADGVGDPERSATKSYLLNNGSENIYVTRGHLEECWFFLLRQSVKVAAFLLALTRTQHTEVLAVQ